MDAPSDAFLWVKHYILLLWCAGSLHCSTLPRLYVYHAMSRDTVSHQRFDDGT